MQVQHRFSRRLFLRSSAAAAAAFMALPRLMFRTSQADSPREPMDTHIRRIDGTSVLFQYGLPVPSFDTWQHREASRGYIDLNGTWRFRFDPEDEGMAHRWYSPCYDDSDWRQVEVPLPWDLYDTPDFGTYDGRRYGQGTAFYDGYAWYRKRVHVPAGWKHKAVRIHFLGVSYRAWVYVNGHLIGVREGGHTPFALDISRYVRPGRTALIAVRVFRRRWWSSYDPVVTNPTPVTDDRELPYKPVDYWPYAGITRDVYIEAVAPLSIVKLLAAASDFKLDVRVVLHNYGCHPITRLLCVSPGPATGAAPKSKEVKVAPGQTRVVAFEFDIPSARWWKPSDPVLYRLEAWLLNNLHSHHKLEDSLTVNYGMRRVDVVDAQLRVNHHPVFLKGVNWHEETAERGRSMTMADYDRELQLVLDAGANFVRNCVYNRHPYVYAFADSRGLFVLDDIDNMWLDTAQEALQLEYGLSRALAMMMVWNQMNNPSVIIWCLQNESQIWQDTQVYRSWIKDMKDAVKALDIQGRPVTWASSSSWDPAFDLADVIGFNEYFGYFYGQDSDLGPVLDAVHSTYPEKPILITENGTWSIYGNHGSADEAGTEEWHAAKFRAHWQQVTDTCRLSYMAGYTFWLLKDYKERMTYNRDLNGISTMGLVTFDTEARRLVYDEFKQATVPSG